jgi:hypothetical protein
MCQVREPPPERSTMVKPVRLAVILAGACALGALLPRPSEAQTDSPAAQATPAAGTLTGLAAWNALVGNTITGKSVGDSFSEFFDPGGSVKYVDKNGASSGTWAVQGGKVCIDFPEDDDRSCPKFEVTGKTGTYVDDDGGAVIHFEILPGNSKGL